MNVFVNSDRLELSRDASEPIDLTRLTHSPENMSEKDCTSTTKSSEDDIPSKKSRFRGKNKIDIEFITKKSRRQSTFSKRKTGLMKKAFELAELTGAEVLLMIASDTNHVYTYGTSKMKPVFESEQGKLLIEACLNGSGNSKHEEQFIKNEAGVLNEDIIRPNKMHSTNQLHFNFNNSSCIDSKVLLPFSINNNIQHTNSTQKQKLSSQDIFQNSNNTFTNSISKDNLVLSNVTSHTSLLVPISMASLSTILPKNN